MPSPLHLVRQRDYLYVRGLLPDKKEIIPSVGVPTGARLVNQWIATGCKVGEEIKAEAVLKEVSIDLQKWEWGIPFPWDKWAKRNKKKEEKEKKRKDKKNPCVQPPLSSSYESPFALGATSALPTLNEAWELFLLQNQLSEQTLFVRQVLLSPVLSTFGHLPITHDLPFSIYQWAQSHFSPAATSARLSYLSSITDCLLNKGLLSDNPFRGQVWIKGDGSIVKKETRGRKKRRSIEYFTETERESLLKQYPPIERDGKRSIGERDNGVLYGLFCRFCFFTGCRLGEAAGLTWDCIQEDRLLFNKVVAITKAGLQMQQGLKSQDYRPFPINSQLKDLLLLLSLYRELLAQHYKLELEEAPARVARDWNEFVGERRDVLKKDFGDREIGLRKLELVFPAFSSKLFYFNIRAYLIDFAQRLKMANLPYRRPYTTRHTFISSCLEKGIPVNDVAKWVGNSPTVIYKNYASSLIAKEVPLL